MTYKKLIRLFGKEENDNVKGIFINVEKISFFLFLIKTDLIQTIIYINHEMTDC